MSIAREARASIAETKLAQIRELAIEWAKPHEPAKPSDWLYGFDEGGRTAGEWLIEIIDGEAAE